MVQMGGVLRYKREVYCGVSLSSRLRSQQGTALQMGGVLRCKLEVYCQCFSDKLSGLGVPEQCPGGTERSQKSSLVSKPTVFEMPGAFNCQGFGVSLRI